MSGQFGDRLQIDRYWVRDLTGANHCFLGIVDMATNYQQTIRLTGQGAKDVYHALCQVWFKPFGHPLVIEADDDRNFEGEFKERIEGFGTHLLIVPAEAHWRIGSIERKNAILRSTMEKMIDEYGVTHPEMLDDIALAATQAINSSVTSKGRTPYQAVFGRLPRFPGDILGDERALLANYDAVYAEEMRSHALRIIAETRASHAVRRALLRKTAPSREEAQAILPGSMAAYWRWQKKSKGRKRGGYVLARLMSHDPDNKSAWLHNGNSVVQATYEQIRPAFGIENWCPSSQDIQMLRDGSTRLQKGLWQDERGPPPPRLEAPAPEVEFERAEPIPDLVMPLALKPSPATPAPIPKTPDLPRPQPMVYSPTFKQQNVQVHQHFEAPQAGPSFGLPPENVPVPPSEDDMIEGGNPELPEPPVPALPPDPGLPQLPADGEQETPVLMDATAPPHREPETGEPLNKQPRHEVMLMTSQDRGRLQQITPRPDGWDGSPIIESDNPCMVYRTVAAEMLNEPLSSASSDDEQRKQPSDLARMSRQERKAMDREIPWREIMKKDKGTLEAFIIANIKEFQSWLSWESIRALTEAESKAVYASAVLKRRIIPARNAYRDKNRSIPPLKAKCRTVVLGCLDPDMEILDRTSPTPSRHAEAILLQLARGGLNARVERQKHRWKLWAGDVSTAFLQGSPEARPLPLYMKPPRDGIQQMAKTFPAELYEVVGNLYGFCSAPRTWTTHVTKVLMNDAKLTRHKLEHMMFYSRDANGYLEVCCIVHVDDFLVAFRDDYDTSRILGKFNWGSQTYLTEETPITFRGKELRLVKDGDLFAIKVTQEAFINEITPGKVEKKRLGEGIKLSPDEWKEFRSCAGSLQWLSGQSRPDISALVSLSNHGKDTTTKELQQLYECIDMVKNTAALGLLYHPVSFDRAMHLVGYSDSSRANAPGGKSQMGVLILACSPACLSGTARASILDWKSARSPRVTRSTLASEANSMDETADRATYINSYISELLYEDYVLGQCHLAQLQVTDCRSLYDALLSPNPALSEKRTIITVRSIQEHVDAKSVRWTPTNVMWADCLTKASVELISTFQQWMERPVCTIVDPKEKYTSVNFTVLHSTAS